MIKAKNNNGLRWRKKNIVGRGVYGHWLRQKNGVRLEVVLRKEPRIIVYGKRRHSKPRYLITGFRNGVLVVSRNARNLSLADAKVRTVKRKLLSRKV